MQAVPGFLNWLSFQEFIRNIFTYDICPERQAIRENWFHMRFPNTVLTAPAPDLGANNYEVIWGITHWIEHRICMYDAPELSQSQSGVLISLSSVSISLTHFHEIIS